MKRTVAALAVLAVLAAPAAAQPSAVDPDPEPEPETHTQHYGWKIAVVDVASVGIAFLGLVAFYVHFDATDDSDEMGPTVGTTGSKIWAVAGGTYLLGGPIIHGLHGNKAAAKSFGLRAGLPLAGALTGSVIDDGPGLSVGLAALGIVMAMVIDDAALAHREVRTGRSVAPYAAPTTGGGVTLGVAGAF